jgi:hypothetical protein
VGIGEITVICIEIDTWVIEKMALEKGAGWIIRLESEEV